MRVVIGISFMLVLMLLCYPALSTEQRRVALVIGNDDYQKVIKLEKAGNDARAMAHELKVAGFEVMEYHNLNYQNMVKVVEVFSNRINGGDQVVVFFAGHGVQIKTGSYLLPVDIEVGSERQVEKTAYGLADLTDRLSEAKASFALVVVDACRDNPLKSKGRNIGNTRGLSAIEPPKGQMVVYSASKGQQALDRLSEKDNNPNSVFTRAFIARMKKPGVRIEEMLREVQDAVEELAQSVSHEQRPAIYNESRGNFYFFGPTTVNVQSPTPAPSLIKSEPVLSLIPGKDSKSVAAASDDLETNFWNAVKSSGAGEYFDAYIKKYPKGKYVGLARIELKKLNDQKQAEKDREKDAQNQAAKQLKAEIARAEQEFWEQAKSDNTIAAYENYLTRYPGGKFVALAQANKQKILREMAEREKQAQEAAIQQEKLARQKREAEEQAKAVRAEQEYWEQAKSDNTIAAYKNYLTRYPGGKFVALAQAAQQKILREMTEKEKQAQEAAAQQEKLARQKYEAEEQAKAVRAEQEFWEQAKSDNTIAAYKNYLTRYSQGKFVTMAQAAQQKILRETAEKEKQAQEAVIQQEKLARQKREAEEQAKAVRAEQEYWEQAKSDNTIAAYKNYLTRYPQGKFVALAQAAQQKILREAAEREKQEVALRQEELARQKREAEAEAARVEQEFWEQARSDNTTSAYENYLTRYPVGQFVALAQANQQKILQEKAEREKQAQEEAAKQEELARQKREADLKAEMARVERESWEQTKFGNTITAYENYLTRYPEGQFVALAQAGQQKILWEKAEREKQEEALRQEELARQKREAEAKAIRIEQESWEQTKSGNTITAYENYLTRYPEGQFVALAQAAHQKILREKAEREKKEEAVRQEELARQKREAEAKAIRVEQEFWEQTKSGDTIAAYENYLTRYPGGQFLALAQAKHQELVRLKREEEEYVKAARAEQESWEQAKSSNIVAAYENYLTRYPEGKFVLLAQAAQQKILREQVVALAQTLFTLTADGTIIDAQTGLEWVVGPDENTNYSQAEKWLAACVVAGGGWRMPTMSELNNLYQKGVDVQNMGQIFKANGSFVWGEPKDWLSAWNFNFRNGKEKWDTRYDSANNRVFGVRSR